MRGLVLHVVPSGLCIHRVGVLLGSARSHSDNDVKVELDSHADTCVVGKNVLLLREHTRVVNVSGFDPSQPARQAKIVDCALKYISPATGEPALLTINQALLVPELDALPTLSNAMQVEWRGDS